MSTVPRYESSRKYPSARTAGFQIADPDNVIGVGMSEEQFIALLSRQDPSIGSEIKITEADPKSVEESGWRTIAGEQMTPEQLNDAVKVGIYHVRGEKVSLLVERAVDVYSHLRVGTMAMVLIDWE